MQNKHGARQLLLQQSFGVLATIAVDLPGYPFGSVTPYSVDERGQPIIYISSIAQHTRNILADSRVSLTVVEPSNQTDDVQARGRVTCVADARSLGEDKAGNRERYFRHFPSARQYDQTHDFAFFRLDIVRVRFIGGFGQIYWVDPQEFLLQNPFNANQEARIIQHMNEDHAAALQAYAGGPATMTGIDGEGIDLLAAGRKIRIDFESPVRTMEEARIALVAMARSMPQNGH